MKGLFTSEKAQSILNDFPETDIVVFTGHKPRHHGEGQFEFIDGFSTQMWISVGIITVRCAIIGRNKRSR